MARWKNARSGYSVRGARVHRAPEKCAVVLLHDVAEMRGEDDIIERAQRVLDRQWLDIEDVEAGAGDTLFA